MLPKYDTPDKTIYPMKTIRIILLTIGLALFSEAAQAQYSTYYYQRATLFEAQPVAAGDIVFLGDSITDGGEWGELFGGGNFKNRGISGDISQGVCDRLDAVVSGRPAKIFLMIGVNDLSRGIPDDTIVGNIGKIIDKVHTDSPDTRVYLQSILPVNEDKGMFESHTARHADIAPLNARLRALAADKGAVYIDLFSSFTEEGTDKLNPALTNDGLHLLGAGYLLWKKIVAPYVYE